jgi:lambda repressor-like predicted transcriptional regulator
MTPTEIKIELLRKGYSITGLAREFGCRREELSMCVHQSRVYPEIQEKLARKLGYSRQHMFGSQAKRASVA